MPEMCKHGTPCQKACKPGSVIETGHLSRSVVANGLKRYIAGWREPMDY